ncbi:MAG: hypothetical protein ABJO36_04720 [Litorimonas sp.]
MMRELNLNEMGMVSGGLGETVSRSEIERGADPMYYGVENYFTDPFSDFNNPFLAGRDIPWGTGGLEINIANADDFEIGGDILPPSIGTNAATWSWTIPRDNPSLLVVSCMEYAEPGTDCSHLAD